MPASDEMIFACRADFREWLSCNSTTNAGVWLTFGKDGKLQTLKPDEALAEALCFGWIDGRIQSIDGTKYRKRFSPRRKGSKWSAKNRSLAEDLTARGLMAAPGLAAIARAKQDGTWDTPQPAPIAAEQIAALLEALHGHEPALTNLLKMPPSVRRTYAAHYLSAKTEQTRMRRLEQIIGRLNENLRPM